MQTPFIHGMTSCAPEVYAFPAPLETPLMVIQYSCYKPDDKLQEYFQRLLNYLTFKSFDYEHTRCPETRPAN